MAPLIESIIADIFEVQTVVEEKMGTEEEEVKIDRSFEHLGNGFRYWQSDFFELFDLCQSFGYMN